MMIRTLGLVTVAVVAIASSPARAATEAYAIDPVHSYVGFKVRHLMVSDVKGSFGTFSGTITVDPANLEASSVEVTIDAASISTKNDRRDSDLKSANFFDVEKFPTITFKSKKVMKQGEQWIAVGDFTMHGVTKEIQLPFTLSGPVAMGENSVIGVSSGTKLNRFDYGIKWDKKLDAGGMVVGETVTIELEIEARK